MNLNKKSTRGGCPICNNKFCEILHTQMFILPEKNILPSNYDLVCCEKCGFVYADVSANQSDYDFYYRELSKYEDKKTASGTGDNIFDKQRLADTANDINLILKDKNKTILDFGCGNGGLLLELKSLGYKKIEGIDPSDVCVNNIKKNGLKASIGSIFNYDCDKKFDLVVFTHVFEHIQDLKKALYNASTLLNEDGKIYIEVPDASRYKNFYKVPYYYFDIEHINHFNEKSLFNLLSINNFKLILSEKKEFMFSLNEPYPAVWVVGQKNENIEKKVAIVKDDSARNSVINYINMSKDVNLNVNLNTKKYEKQIRKLKINKEEVVIWGAGNYTMRMLANSDLGLCNIKFFIDKDSKKWGQRIRGIEIKKPKAIMDFYGVIVISSVMFSDEIINEIRGMGKDNKLIVL